MIYIIVILIKPFSEPSCRAENNFTPAQFDSLAGILRAWKELYPNAEVVGHRDLPSKHARLKDCPSFNVKAWLEANPLYT